MRWITRERPKIDRVACPWLIRNFVDHDAEFIFAPPEDVLAQATATNAIPFDVEGVELSHVGPSCSFDAILAKYNLNEAALHQIADIVRGADTARLDLAPESAGLLAISLGLSRMFSDDHEQLKHGYVLYDALYLWCKDGQAERHDWNPQAAPTSHTTPSISTDETLA